MARKADTATPESTATELAPAVIADARQALATVNAQAAELATQLGYDGSLTVGALEDEIRFYQRRTVEALLESGKRLLLLQELTPRGEFDQRVELLGFSRRSAYRFMQAAAKTAKSANLALLSTHVKNASAFLELVTHDEDTLTNIAELDDIDRMSAGELRTALREAQQNAEAQGQLIAKKDEKLNELDAKLTKHKKLKVAVTDWPERFKGLIDQADLARRTIETQIGALDAIRAAAMEDEPADEAEEASLHRARESLAANMSASILRLSAALEGFSSVYEKTLGAFVPEEA
jgi:hypothetical protein